MKQTYIVTWKSSGRPDTLIEIKAVNKFDAFIQARTHSDLPSYAEIISIECQGQEHYLGMLTDYAMVRKMHEQFKIQYDGPPRDLPEDLKGFRVDAIQEELNEYKEATTLEDQFDALLDIMVFTLGAIEWHGFDFHRGFTEVMRANLEKELGKNKKARNKNNPTSPDLVKPKGWVGPDLSFTNSNGE